MFAMVVGISSALAMTAVLAGVVMAILGCLSWLIETMSRQMGNAWRGMTRGILHRGSKHAPAGQTT
jgi:hypothetical protein